jgi:hypothetical protein
VSIAKIPERGSTLLTQIPTEEQRCPKGRHFICLILWSKNCLQIPLLLSHVNIFIYDIKINTYVLKVKKKGKASPVTGHGDPQGCETSSLPHFLETRLKDGSEEVSLKRRPPLTSQEDSRYSFLLEAVSTPGPWWGWNWKHPMTSSGYEPRDLPTCRIMPQSSKLPRASVLP